MDGWMGIVGNGVGVSVVGVVGLVPGSSLAVFSVWFGPTNTVDIDICGCTASAGGVRGRLLRTGCGE